MILVLKLKFSIFWDVTQLKLVVCYTRFGCLERKPTTHRSCATFRTSKDLSRPLVVCLFVCFWRYIPPPFQWGRASPFTRFLDHTQKRTTVGSTPLDEGSARRRDLYLTTLKTDRHSCPRWDSNAQSQ